MARLRFLNVQVSGFFQSKALVFELDAKGFTHIITIGQALDEQKQKLIFNVFTKPRTTLQLVPLEMIEDPSKTVQTFQKEVLEQLKKFGTKIKGLDESVTNLELDSLKKSLHKKDLVFILRLLEDSQNSFYVFLVAGILLTFISTFLLDFPSTSDKNRTFNQSVFFENNELSKEKIKSLKEKVKDFIFFFKDFIFSLFKPTKLLSNNYCFDIYNRQKDTKDSLTLEELTSNFISMRSLIIRINKDLAVKCIFLGFAPLSSRFTFNFFALFFKNVPNLTDFLYQNSLKSGWAKTGNALIFGLLFYSVNQFLIRPVVVEIVEKSQTIFVYLQKDIFFPQNKNEGPDCSFIQSI